MNTTIRILKREAGIAPDGAGPEQLLAEARALRARTLAALGQRAIDALRARTVTRGPLHPAA